MSWQIFSPDRPTYRPGADPTDSQVFGYDFAGELADGDTLTGTPTATISDGTVGTPSLTGTICKVRVSGLTADTTACVTFTVSTTGGDTIQRSIYIPARQR